MVQKVHFELKLHHFSTKNLLVEVCVGKPCKTSQIIPVTIEPSGKILLLRQIRTTQPQHAITYFFKGEAVVGCVWYRSYLAHIGLAQVLL